MEEDRYVRITLRIPRELHARLEGMADQTSKSLNAEIVGRLEESFTAPVTNFQQATDSQVAAMQNRVEMLAMRFDLARSRADNLDIRSRLIAAEAARLAKEAQTDEDFAAAQRRANELVDVEAEAAVLRDELKAIAKDRDQAIQDFTRLDKILTTVTDEMDRRVNEGRAAKEAAAGVPKPRRASKS